MANTPNLDLVKPAGTDKALVSVINSNSDKIDAGFGSLSDQIENICEDLTSSVTINSGVSKCSVKRIGKIVFINCVATANLNTELITDLPASIMVSAAIATRAYINGTKLIANTSLNNDSITIWYIQQ